MKKQLLTFAILASTFTYAQSWNLTGNSVTNSTDNFVGTTDGQPFVLKSNNIEGLRIYPDGNVKIGTNDPADNNGSILRIYKSENTLVEIANSLGRFQMFRSSCND